LTITEHRCLLIKRLPHQRSKEKRFKLANIPLIITTRSLKITDVEGATYNIETDGQIKVTPIDKADILKQKPQGKTKS